MNIQTALALMAQTWGFDNSKLQIYGIGTDIGGWHTSAERSKWPMGSIWEAEGKVLYALTRILDPQIVLDLGTYYGCSTTHIATALLHNQSGGRLICVENGHQGVPQPGNIPLELQSMIEFVNDNAEDYVERPDLDWSQIGLVFEDTLHTAELTSRLWRSITARLKPGAMLVSHDAEHFSVGHAVKQGIMESGVQDWRSYAIETDGMDRQHLCGLAMWRKPEIAPLQAGVDVINEGLERAAAAINERIEKAKATSKRTPAKRKTPTKRASKAKA